MGRMKGFWDGLLFLVTVIPADLRQGFPSRMLLGFLLVSADSATIEFTTDEDLCSKGLFVLRTFKVGQLIPRGTSKPALTDLLYLGLKIAIIGQSRFDEGEELLLNDPKSRLESPVEVDGTDEGLISIGNQGTPLSPSPQGFSFSQEHVLVYTETFRYFSQKSLVNEAGPQLRQRPLLAMGMVFHDEVTDDDIEDGISQEFEPFIIHPCPTGPLISIRSVGERHIQQVRILKPIGYLLLQFR